MVNAIRPPWGVLKYRNGPRLNQSRPVCRRWATRQFLVYVAVICFITLSCVTDSAAPAKIAPDPLSLYLSLWGRMKTTPRAASYKREGRRCAWERLTARRVEGRMRGEGGGRRWAAAVFAIDAFCREMKNSVPVWWARRDDVLRAVSRTIYELRLAVLCDSLIQESEVAYRRRLL